MDEYKATVEDQGGIQTIDAMEISFEEGGVWFERTLGRVFYPYNQILKIEEE